MVKLKKCEQLELEFKLRFFAQHKYIVTLVFCKFVHKLSIRVCTQYAHSVIIYSGMRVQNKRG